MADLMTFPDTVEEFMEQYKVVDTDGIYMSKGAELVPIFRMRQWFEHLPSAQPEQGWIPCEKELPEEYGEYRITWITSASKKRFIGDAEYEVTGEWDAEHDRFKGEWLLDEYIDYPDVKVLAWKPLEEPYQEEGGE